MNVEALKTRLREVRAGMDENHAIRLHRAISWLMCAERYAREDDDLCFITLWIAFDSLLSVDDGRSGHANFRDHFEAFAAKLCRLDSGRKIYQTLWHNFSSFVRLLIDNHYVFGPFWQSQRTGDASWREKFERSRKRAHRALADGDCPTLLSVVIDRLYVLRNQLVHGGATYRSSKNREQVRNGKGMLLELVPVFIEIMFDERETWGDIHYPVVS